MSEFNFQTEKVEENTRKETNKRTIRNLSVQGTCQRDTFVRMNQRPDS